MLQGIVSQTLLLEQAESIYFTSLHRQDFTLQISDFSDLYKFKSAFRSVTLQVVDICKALFIHAWNLQSKPGSN